MTQDPNTIGPEMGETVLAPSRAVTMSSEDMCMFQAVQLENYFIPSGCHRDHAGLPAPSPPAFFPYQTPESSYRWNYRGPMKRISVHTVS